MAHRNIHYEAAFEDYLRCKGWPYVAVDETKKTIFAGASIKSFDFLVYSAGGVNLLVDVKGRKFPDPTGRSGRAKTRAWENWITREDVEGLTKWERVFGPDFAAALVFAYWLEGPVQQTSFDEVHFFRERNYTFVAMMLGDYISSARPRSAKWRTIAMPSAEFANRARDISALL